MNYFLLNIGQQLINLTDVLITLFVECFPAIFKNITHALYKKNFPAKRDELFILEKNVPPKRNLGFMKVGSLVGGRINFHINRFRFFNRILLLGKILLKRGPRFTGIILPHIKILLITFA